MLLWVIFAVMTAAGLTAVLWPLLRPAATAGDIGTSDLAVYRDQLSEVERDLARGVLNAGDAESARREISRRLLAADAARTGDAAEGAGGDRMVRRAIAVATVVAIPAIGLVTYLIAGSPGLVGRPLAERLAGPLESRSMPELVARVEAHLRDNPEDTKGWRVLAPVYMRLGRFADAADAYRHVLRVEGRQPDALGNYGEALTQMQDGLITADAREAFAEANRLAPDLAKPRYYLGLAELQDGNTEAAVETWRTLLAESPADAPWRATVEEQIAKATGVPALSGSAPQIDQETMSAAQGMSAGDRSRMIEGMVERLAKRLEAEGGNIEEWLRLARAQMVLGRREEAGATLERARTAFAGDAARLAQIDEFAAGMAKP